MNIKVQDFNIEVEFWFQGTVTIKKFEGDPYTTESWDIVNRRLPNYVVSKFKVGEMLRGHLDREMDPISFKHNMPRYEIPAPVFVGKIIEIVHVLDTENNEIRDSTKETGELEYIMRICLSDVVVSDF